MFIYSFIYLHIFIFFNTLFTLIYNTFSLVALLFINLSLLNRFLSGIRIGFLSKLGNISVYLWLHKVLLHSHLRVVRSHVHISHSRIRKNSIWRVMSRQFVGFCNGCILFAFSSSPEPRSLCLKLSLAGRKIGN